MTDALVALPRLSWRGIEVPITGNRTATFAHDDVRHKLSFRDNKIVESLGASNWSFSYTIPMRQDIARGPYRNLYTEVLPRFILACRDRTPGDLVDPELGLFLCKPTEFTSTLDVTKRDGTDIQVEFVLAPPFEEPDFEILGTLSVDAIATQAGLLDGEVATVDWEQEEPPEPSLDPLTAIDSVGRQIEFAANRVSNKLDDTAFRLEKLEDTIDRLENPQNWPLRRSSRRLREATIRAKQRGDDPLRRIITVTQRYNATVGAVARDADMTVDELLALNPGLAGSPLVPQGSQVRLHVAPTPAS